MLGLALLTGALVFVPSESNALPSDAWISGVVSDEIGDPIAGVYVKVMLFTAGGLDIGYDFTDALGEYVIGVPGGFEYMVLAANGSYYMSMTMVKVMSGETANADLTLEAIDPVVADITIKGYVKDEYGVPAVDGHVLGISNDPMGADMPFYANVTTPDGAGYFEVNVIESPGGGGAVAFDNEGYQMVDNSTESPIVSGETYWFNITLTSTSSADDSRIYGQVLDAESGLPISGVLVSIDAWNMYLPEGYANYTFTDMSGHYEMNVTNGTADIWFTKGGYSMVMYEDETINPGDELEFGASLIELNCVVRGNITDKKSGLPVEFARAVVMDSEGNMAMTVTNGSGVYELDAFDGADLWLFAEADGYSRNFTVVTLSPGDEVWYDFGLLPVSAWLEGTVTDAISGLPVEGVWVEANSEEYYDSDDTDASGYYNISLVPGDYEVTARTMDYREFREAVTVLDEETAVLDIPLIPWDLDETVFVSGFVTDSVSTDPLMDAEVTVALPDLSSRNSTRTDGTGYYEMYVAPLDGMPFLVTAWAHGPASGALDCAGETSLDRDFQLAPDPYGPNITYDQTPLENVSWTNPMTVHAEVEDLYLSRMMMFNFMHWYTEDGRDHMYLVGGASVSFNPLEPSSGLEYSMDGDIYVVHEEFDGLMDDYSLMGGWVQDGASSLYVVAYEQWWGMEPVYALRAQYTNDSLGGTNITGTAAFDYDTGEFLMFYMDWGEPLDDSGDPSGTVAMVVSSMSFEEADPSNWTWHDQVSLGGMDMSSLEFVPEPVAPSGGYAVLFAANDFGHQGQWFVTPYAVDNDEPVADAGPDQDVVVDTECTFDGGGSSEDVVSYTWQFDDGGTIMTFTEVTFGYTFTVVGTYEVTLTVVDGALHEATATATVEVSADAPPVADAGADQDVDEDTPFTFDGIGSYDDVDITNYTWTIIELDVEMYGVAPEYTFADPDEYTVELVVTDTIDQESDPDTMVLTVLDVTAPEADAGPDPTGVLEGSVVEFDGSGSTDNVAIVSYVWTCDAFGGTPYDGVTAEHVFTDEGEYDVTLTVTDAAGNTDTDIVVVRVAAFDDPPDADAGDDQEVEAGDTVEFDGSGSSDDFGIEDYTWTFEYDGELRTLTGETAEFVFEIPGTYIVTLNVTDEAGQSDIDTMYVIVEDKASTFMTEYWWLLAVVAAVAVIGVLVVLMKRGKGGPGPQPDTDEELEEEELPPPDDE